MPADLCGAGFGFSAGFAEMSSTIIFFSAALTTSVCAAAGGELNTSELLAIAGTLRAVRSLYEWYGHFSSVRTNLDFFFEGITVNKYLEAKIFSVIISEDEKVIMNFILLLEDRIKKLKDESEDKLYSELYKYIEDDSSKFIDIYSYFAALEIVSNSNLKLEIVLSQILDDKDL